MTYIQQPDMDIHAPAIDEYARYGGLKPGMVVGTKTSLPMFPDEPDIEETLVDAAKLAVVAGIVGGFIVLGCAAIVLAAFLNGVLS